MVPYRETIGYMPTNYQLHADKLLLVGINPMLYSYCKEGVLLIHPQTRQTYQTLFVSFVVYFITIFLPLTI